MKMLMPELEARSISRAPTPDCFIKGVRADGLIALMGDTASKTLREQ